MELLKSAGWTYKPSNTLDRPHEAVLVESELAEALIRLNPVIAEDPERAEQVISSLRALTISAHEDGLVQANKAMHRWLRGEQTVEFVGMPSHEPVKLIDFRNPANNTYTVSDEVTLGVPGNSARFDIVLWVNGIPLAVGETKTNVSAQVSWLKAAKDIHDVYERKWPQFFVTNVLSFGTEGKEFRYGAPRQPVDKWSMWGSTEDAPTLDGWPRVKRSVELLLNPRMLLKVLADYTLYEQAVRDGAPVLRKILPRYPQVEASEAIYRRVLEAGNGRGLIYHTQGSGKTLAMAFCAAKLLKNPAMKNPTIIIVADRTQLVSQTSDQFQTTGLPRMKEPETSGDLRQLLDRDQRGIIFTTVHKFEKAGRLNDRSNIVVLIDEAHRAQEGSLGLQMREALPNAKFFGFTGTPIANRDKNTFALYGDPRDPNHALSTYDSDRSIADGTTVPMHVAARLVDFHIDREELDAAFEELADIENLDEEQKDYIAGRIGSLKTIVSNPERVQRVSEDILEHFYTTVDPLGMKAQIVVYDRSMCVAYGDELSRQLAERAQPDQEPDEAAVVMTAGKKSDPADWDRYDLSEAQEDELLNRFRNFNDPLKFLIVTSKLGTGFNADNEGVLYLDKPLRLHTLYQTITRTNRTWKNPATGQEKKYGLIVDYFGLGDEFAKAISPADPSKKKREIDIDGLVEQFAAELDETLSIFVGIDRSQSGFAALEQAQERIPPGKYRDRFAAQFGVLEGIWEHLWPNSGLDGYKDDFKWLSKVYESVRPRNSANELLWHRLGAKTLQLVHSHISPVSVSDADLNAVVADEDTIARMREQGLLEPAKPGKRDAPVTVEEVVDSIAERIKKRVAGPNGDHPAFKSLAERLERIRETTIQRAEDSVEYLRSIFVLAKDLKVAERAEDEEGERGLDLLPDPHIGALTQIFEEFKPEGTPVIIESVVKDIDTIVKDVSYSGWNDTQAGDKAVRVEIRKVLNRYGLRDVKGLFERAHEYIAANY